MRAMAAPTITSLLLLTSMIVRAQDLTSWNTLQKLDTTPSGHVFYGPLANETSLKGALLTALGEIHARFGRQPQLSQLLKTRNGASLSAFFATNDAQDHDKPIDGLLVVAMTTDSVPQVAIFYDDAGAFVSTEPALATLLRGSTLTTSEEPIVEPLALTSGGDRSASICLATDWKIAEVANGALNATGPHGERMSLGNFITVTNLADPHSAVLKASPSKQGATAGRYPEQSNLYQAFIDVVNQKRALANLEPAIFKHIFSKKIEVADPVHDRAVEVTYYVDLADGVGERWGSARIDALRFKGMPQWGMAVSTSTLPLAYVATEQATLRAMIQSFRLRPEPSGIRDVMREQEQALAFESRIRERSTRQNCAEESRRTGWPEDVLPAFIVAPLFDVDSPTFQPPTPTQFADALLKNAPKQFETVAADEIQLGEAY